jgi:hypothetical protein
MPTILLRKGWRVFFFANENNEPMHVHCRKGSATGKFWILPDEYDINTAYVRRMTRQEEREIRKILFESFDEITEAWNAFQEKMR